VKLKKNISFKVKRNDSVCKVGALDKKNIPRKKAEILDLDKIDHQINTLEMYLFIRQVVKLLEMYKHN